MGHVELRIFICHARFILFVYQTSNSAHIGQNVLNALDKVMRNQNIHFCRKWQKKLVQYSMSTSQKYLMSTSHISISVPGYWHWLTIN